MKNSISKFRSISRVVKGTPATDGAGVKLTRVMGTSELNMLDPFLLLDEFRSDKPEDYIAGFPNHPHRGFETVTYLLAGRLRHKDNAGYEGVIERGGVQWMTAGRGIIHSEMPEQENGFLHGFQLWINLPSSEKMRTPAYQEFSANEIPSETRSEHLKVRVISGITSAGTEGPVRGKSTEPVFLDVVMTTDLDFIEPINPAHNAFVFLYEGECEIGHIEDEVSPVHVKQGTLVVLENGDGVRIRPVNNIVKFLLFSAKPINEPVARGGPFVMNTSEEINQAALDYQQGKFQ